MVVTVFRPRLHYKGARAQKLQRKQKFRRNSEFFPAPARFFAARLTAPARAGAILTAELSDGEWYLTSDHPMRREHYLSFAALVNEDTVVLRRLYPEWGAQTRLPYFAHGTLMWYCTQHGLFAQPIDAHKK